MELRLSDFAAVCGGELHGDCVFTNVEIDSRKVRPGDLFVCLKGERVDGHDYAENAASAGAVGILCERKTNTELPYLLVEDSVKSLQQFATGLRIRKHPFVVAVTGSVGKTSTKECIYAVLNEKYRTHKTPGNLNSETGVPRTILGMTEEDEALVVEMGMSARGEISVLTHIALPDVAVITCIGVSHLEHLGSRENICRAKLEILEGLDKNGTVVYNGDDPYLAAESETLNRFRTVTFGYSEACTVRAEDVQGSAGSTSFTAVTPDGRIRITLPCEGKHNVMNAMAAVCVGLIQKIPPEKIAEGLTHFRQAPMRGQQYEKDGVCLIEDCYNAGPESMTAALALLASKPGRHISVLGDMLELGALSDEMHRQIGAKAAGMDVLIFFGNHNACYSSGAVRAGADADKMILCANSEEAGRKLKAIARAGDVVLVKASRGMHGEKVIEKFLEKE